mmetsp:Transcript_19250/g.53689  ORF Transcript_19250/g.53689 Transcript_19250/m.53689 type:complete len:278 (-) Transcript_19250:1536-2369(-)
MTQYPAQLRTKASSAWGCTLLGTLGSGLCFARKALMVRCSARTRDRLAQPWTHSTRPSSVLVGRTEYSVSLRSRFSFFSRRSIRDTICTTSWSCRRSSPRLYMRTTLCASWSGCRGLPAPPPPPDPPEGPALEAPGAWGSWGPVELWRGLRDGLVAVLDHGLAERPLVQVPSASWRCPGWQACVVLNERQSGLSADLNTVHCDGMTPDNRMEGSSGFGRRAADSSPQDPVSDIIACSRSAFFEAPPRTVLSSRMMWASCAIISICCRIPSHIVYPCG